MINVTAAYDGQGAFKNGMNDAICGINKKDNVYRKIPISDLSHTFGASIRRFLWRCGHLFQRMTGLGYVNRLTPCGICRHWNDPERMLMPWSPPTSGPLLCQKCAKLAAGDQP